MTLLPHNGIYNHQNDPALTNNVILKPILSDLL